MIQLFVPGRLCLLGEHTDWAGKYRTMNADIVAGASIVTGVEEGIYAEVIKSDKFEIEYADPCIKEEEEGFSCIMNETALKEVAKSGDFFCYCAGVASYMLEWYNVGGVKITITKMTLPMKSGLSSSAAICVLVARAFNQIYKLNLNTMGEMNIAYWGELRTSSRCGRLDQACAFGVKPSLMTFDGEDVEVKPLTVRKHLYWVFADLCAEKDTIKILRDLNKAFPFASNEKEEKVQLALGQINQQFIERAIKYMAEGKAEELGQLMTETEKVFDDMVAPMCPEQLNAPKLKKVLNDPAIRQWAWGGKGVGSHGDGSVQFLAKDKESQQKLRDYLNALGLKAYTLTLKPVHTVRKAIIPVAGFGTRLYPATAVLKKDFFPIPCPDGFVRPVILILLEELIKSGIEEICLVLGSEEERKMYKEFFEKPLAEEHLKKLNNESQEYAKHISSIGKRLKYVYQTEKRGFGHAVYQAKEFAGNDPVILLLGDTIYKSSTNKPCALQLIEEYEKNNTLMVAIHEIPLNEVSRYGITTGFWEDKHETIMNVNTFTEKPKKSYAEEFLGVKNRQGEQKFYSVFGQYILTPEVFSQLAENIENAEKENVAKEIELTTALDQIRDKSGMLGIKLQGEMFDMGNPEALRNAIINFSH